MGSSAPISSAPFLAPLREAGSGPATHNMASASLRTASRGPMLAPAASNSESLMEAPSPAPCSTTIAAPRAANFLTVSGMAATRVSSPASLRTAIFNRAALIVDHIHHDDRRDEGDDRAIFEQFEEAVVVP